MTKQVVRIAGGQGFYGDSPMGAIAIAREKAADYLVHDALAELTLSILQKDRQKDPSMGYARDIELMAKTLYPLAFHNGIKIVSNSGGLNPHSAAKKVAEILGQMGVKGVKIAAISGDDLFDRLKEIQESGEPLNNLDSGLPYSTSTFPPTHANVYIGAKCIKDALEQGANLILAGRVADPCLTLGILAYEYGWNLDPATQTQADLDLLASGIAIGHLLECGGQASGGNSYAEWPMDYSLSNLAYPIAHVSPDGSAVFTRVTSEGGKMSRDTLREQLVYEIHDPANYITPDVVVDLTQATLVQLEPDRVAFFGVKGKTRPEKLKLCIGQMEGFMTDQFFFFSWPYAYKKAEKFAQACREIWAKLPIKLDRIEISFVGVNGIHGEAAPLPSFIDDLNEVGVRLALLHKEPRHGKLAMGAIVALGLNGPPGIVAAPGWGHDSRAQLSLWPTLVPRELVQEKIEITEL